MNKNIFKNKLSFLVDYRFGVHNEYQKDEVVVWGGMHPIITRVWKLDDVDEDGIFYHLIAYNRESHNSCTTSWIRKATPSEIKRLDTELLILLEEHETHIYNIIK